MSDDDQSCKLFTLASDGTWMEIGLGTAVVQVGSCDGARLRIETPETMELLLDTPISTEDIYLVQRDTVLVWHDPEIGKDMALSFMSPSGCTQLITQIHNFQTSQRAARGSTMMLENKDSLGSSTTDMQSPWTVSRENIAALAMAAQDNKGLFGRHIMNYRLREQHPGGVRPNTFFEEVVVLWNTLSSQVPPDVAGMRHVGSLTLHLLSAPFNSEQVILAQLVSDVVISDTIDIVQFALRDLRVVSDAQAANFLDRQQRAARSHMDRVVSEALRHKARYLYELTYLKDLLPLQLEDGDPNLGSGMIGSYLLRLKYTMTEEVLTTNKTVFSKATLALRESAAKGPDAAADGEELTEAEQETTSLVSMLHEITTMLRGTLGPLEPKEDLLRLVLDAEGVPFLSAAFQYSVWRSRGSVNANGSTSHASTSRHLGPKQHDWLGDAQKCADVISHFALFAPIHTRTALLAEVAKARDAPPEERDKLAEPLLSQMLTVFTKVSDTVLLQALHDAVLSLSFGIAPQQSQMLLSLHGPLEAETSLSTILLFWLTGKLLNGDAPPSAAPTAAGTPTTVAAATPLSDWSRSNHSPVNEPGAEVHPPFRQLVDRVSRASVQAPREAKGQPGPRLSACDSAEGSPYHILRLLTTLLQSSCAEYPVPTSKKCRHMLATAVAKSGLIPAVASLMVQANARSAKLIAQCGALLAACIGCANNDINTTIIEHDALGPALTLLTQPHRSNVFTSSLRNVFERYFAVADVVSEAAGQRRHSVGRRGASTQVNRRGFTEQQAAHQLSLVKEKARFHGAIAKYLAEQHGDLLKSTSPEIVRIRARLEELTADVNAVLSKPATSSTPTLSEAKPGPTLEDEYDRIVATFTAPVESDDVSLLGGSPTDPIMRQNSFRMLKRSTEPAEDFEDFTSETTEPEANGEFAAIPPAPPLPSPTRLRSREAEDEEDAPFLKRARSE